MSSKLKGILISGAFVAASAAAIYWVLTPPGIDDERSPRVVRLEQLKSQVAPNENQMIALAPWLNADVFKVGAVFPLDGSFAMARSTACDQVTTATTPMTLELSDKTNFGVSPEMEVISAGKINAQATRAVEYSVALTDSEIAPGEVELLNQLYSDPDCLAAIANKDVLVLFGVYRGSEKFGIKRAAQGGLDLGFAISNVQEKLGFDVGFNDEDLFTRDKTAMYWALTKVRLDEPVFGGEDVPDVAKLAIATDLVSVESDYAQRAIPNTEINQPTAAEFEQIVGAITAEGAN